MINYSEIFKNSLDKLKSEGNYRIFADLEKLAGNFPQALNYKDNSVSEVTVWCSNDYLGMSQNQDVLDSMTNALKKSRGWFWWYKKHFWDQSLSCTPRKRTMLSASKRSCTFI